MVSWITNCCSRRLTENTNQTMTFNFAVSCFDSPMWDVMVFCDCYHYLYMKDDDARRLLDRTGILRNACDLDLLIFFVRHPDTLLSSEKLATLLGYDLKEIADSLEILLAGGLLHRKQTSAHAARLYVLVRPTPSEESFASLLEFASTRQGRLRLKAELKRLSFDAKDDAIATGRGDNQVRPDTLPLQARRQQRRLNGRRARGGGR